MTSQPPHRTRRAWLKASFLPHLGCLTALLALGGCAEVEEGREVTRPAAPGQPSEPAPIDEPDEPPVEETPVDEPSGATCDAISSWLESATGVSTCDAELATACGDLAGVLSEDYLAAVAACIDADHSPMTCIFLALGALAPTAAHHQLAATFCDECALDVPGCEELFYFEEDEPIGLGIVALPFSDDIVLEIAEQCTDGLTCAVELPSCAREVIEARLSTDAVAECLFDAVGG